MTIDFRAVFHVADLSRKIGDKSQKNSISTRGVRRSAIDRLFESERVSKRDLADPPTGEHAAVFEVFVCRGVQAIEGRTGLFVFDPYVYQRAQKDIGRQ